MRRRFPLTLIAFFSVLLPCNLCRTGTYATRLTGRSGKSSIQRVVFHKMSPAETLFLESTNKIVKDDVPHSSFVQFQVRG